MKKTLALFLLGLTLWSCGASPKYLPVIDASLKGARGVTEAGKALSEADKSVVGCFVTSAFLTAIDSSQSALDGWSKGEATGVIPSVDVDISACLAMQGEALEPVLEPNAKALVDALAASILPAIESITLLAMEGKDASCKDKAIARAIFDYLGAVKTPLVEELVSPDGMISVPEVALEACP